MTEGTPARAHHVRIVAPDLARGLALFGIAWANISTAWAIAPQGVEGQYFGGVIDGRLIDETTVVASAMFAHVRGLPMFATLLGFGVGLITMSLWRRGFPAGNAQRVLLRRYGFLALIGVLHCVFLFFGDVIVLYSLLSFLLIAMVRLTDKTLLIMAGVLYAVQCTMVVTVSLTTSEVLANSNTFTNSLLDYNSYLEYLRFNAFMVIGYVFSVPMACLSLLPLFIVGFVAARRGVHQQVAKYRGLLWGWAVLTAVVTLGIGLPWGLSAIGVLPNEWELVFAGLNAAFGYVTGPGICAIIVLACQSLQRRVDAGNTLPVPVAVVTALGKRSMSGYILQSVLFLVITQPFTIGFGAQQGAFVQVLIAFGIWVVTLIAAYALELKGYKGPIEAVHRRLAYGKNGLPARYTLPAIAAAA